MLVPHFAGAPNQLIDEMVETESFFDLSMKVSYNLNLGQRSNLKVFGGVRNILNNYQDDFDISKNRDSNYIYGPATPRTFSLGMTWDM